MVWQAWSGMERSGQVWLSLVRYGRRGVAWCSMAGTAWYGSVGLGQARRGRAWQAGHVLVWHGGVRQSKARQVWHVGVSLGDERCRWVWFGRRGEARLSEVRCGPAGRGLARQACYGEVCYVDERYCPASYRKTIN